jgi:putative lipoprotein
MLAFLGLALASCATGGARTSPASAEQGVVRGSVSYRERMVLPSDAVLVVELVELVEASRQGLGAPLIAATTVFPEDREVPLPFELRYDPAKVDPSRSYALRATIHSEAQMLFTTDTVYRVITQGSPTHVDLWLVRVGERTSP